MLNTPKGLYDTCPNPSSRVLRADRYTTIDLFKENYNQPEQLGKKLISKTQGLSERSHNYSDAPKRKDSQQILELKEAIEKNEEYQQACMKEWKLKEAQETKENIKELKRGLLQKQKSQIEEKYQFDLKVLMEAQAEEMNEFNEFWDDKVTEYESEATRVENEVLERHQQEVFKVKDELRKTVPMKRKVSTQYLSYKKTLENLVKQKEFLEAEKVKAICEELEKEERSKAYNEKEQKIKIFMGQLDQRHRNELNVLRKRITAGREGLLKARVMELEKLLLKFQNARYQLEKDKQSGLSKLEVTQRNSMVGEESAYRSSCKAPSNRTYRNSGTTIRMRDSSKMNSLNASMVSPTSTADIQHLSYLSPPAQVGKHKRSQTIVGKDFNVAEVCSMLDQPLEVKSKRSNSVIKQNIDNHEFFQVL